MLAIGPPGDHTAAFPGTEAVKGVGPGWRRAVALAIGALVLRVAYVLLAGHGSGIEPGMDAVEYDAFARLMLSGWHWFTTPLAAREPLYPFLMAVSYALPGPESGMLKAVQILAGAITAPIVYLGLRPLARESVALVAGALVAISPHFVPYAALPYRENLVIPLLTGFFLFAVHLAVEFRWSRVAGCALSLVLLVHTDTRFLPYIFVLPALLLAVNHGWRATARAWGWTLLVFVVLMVPYQIRGPLAFGRPVIVSDRVLEQWLPLLGARWSTSESGVGHEPGRSAWLLQWEAEKVRTLAEVTPEERAYFLAGGRPEIGRLPTYWAQFLEFWRFGRFSIAYRPYPDGRVALPWSKRHLVTSGLVMIPFFILLPFAWWGTPPTERRLLQAILVLLVVHTLLHVVVHARERYRIPVEVFTGAVIAISLVNLGQRLPGRGVSAREAG